MLYEVITAMRGAGAKIHRAWQGGAAEHTRPGAAADLPAAHEREGRRATAAPRAPGDDFFYRTAYGRGLAGRQVV